MYHRIIPYKEAGPGLQAGMYVEPETFSMHIRYLKNNFSVIPLSNVCSLMNDFNVKSNMKPICVLTFDDGWRDFYKYAYPILLKYKVPGTVFLPTKFIGTENTFWTNKIACIIANGKNDKVNIEREITSNNKDVNNIIRFKGSVDAKIENAILMLKNYREENILEILAELREILRAKSTPIDRTFLNWDEVRNMAETGMVTFGSHTDGHKILIHLNDNEIMEEMSKSKVKLVLEKVVDPTCIPFCFPNGDFDERVVRIVNDSGYSIAVTTESGWNKFDTNKMKLKRISIHQDVSSTKQMFGCRIAGIF